MGILENRVAIVTGASSGAGRGAAKRFAEEGALVVACARRKEKLDELIDEIKAGRGTAIAVECDVANDEDIQRVVDVAIAEFKKIDILANIAQGGLGKRDFLMEATIELALEYYMTGPVQTLRFMQACFPYMKERSYGRIINCSSHNVIAGSPGFTSYAMAKGAVAALTRVAAKEWGKYGIVTNTFSPLTINDAYESTDWGPDLAARLAASNPTGRLGQPYEDCSPILAFMASEGAGYLNGQFIGIDGGNILFA